MLDTDSCSWIARGLLAWRADGKYVFRHMSISKMVREVRAKPGLFSRLNEVSMLYVI